MRPLELRVEGFKSYRSAQEFNFESRTLFGIVGPTGAGKSTILEALIFALYGKTPRVERDTKKLISSQDDVARVSLAFDVDELAWEVTRMIRRKGSSQTVLRRLDGRGEPVAGDRAVGERITELLGLDFAGFCSSVSLPQGEFDRFLKATPAERSRILKGIFRLERVDLLREAARRHWSALDGESKGLQAELSALPDRPDERLREAEKLALGARQQRDAIADELPEVIECERDERALQERVRQLSDDLEQTVAAIAGLPSEEALRDLAEREGSASQALEAAHRDREKAQEALDGFAEQEAVLIGSIGSEDWFVELSGAIDSRDRVDSELARQRSELDKLVQQQQHAAQGAQEATGAEESSKLELDEARSRLATVRSEHAAHLLQQGLIQGQPCPVCRQEVTKLPHAPQLPGVDAAQDEVAAAERAHRQAAGLAQAAARALDLAQERSRLAGAAIERLEGEQAAGRRRLEELVGKEADPRAELAGKKRALHRIRSSVAEARAALKSADRAERESRTLVDQLRASTGKMASALAHTSGLVGIDAAVDQGAGLWEVAKKVIEAAGRRRDQLQSRLHSSREEATRARRKVEDFLRRHNADPATHAADVLSEANNRLARADWECEQLRIAVVRRKELAERLEALGERRARFDRLIADFSDSKFTAYLLNEQRKLLSRIGSEKLLELTGHYVFDEEGQFQIIDQRTGMMRSPDTLSGGETFLASLSLALALSEAVSLEGGRLGCFFLDEGFGSLDQESLDLALEGIEALAVPGRLIGLISHVGGIQARLDDLIVLEKRNDGSTEVVQHEGPIGFAPTSI